MTRTDIQDYAVSLTDHHKNVIYELATGVGKSLIAIRIIEKFGGQWKIVIAETNHENNWINEFTKHGMEHLLPNVEFLCYQSLRKHLEGSNYVFDEVHHVTSTLRLELLAQLKLERFIGLSATLTRTQNDSIRAAIGEFKTYKVPLSEAIDLGILPEPTVYFVKVPLDNVHKTLKYYFNKDKWTFCTEQQKYAYMSARIEYLKNRYFMTNRELDKTFWLKAANERKKFLSEVKTPHAAKLLNKLGDKKLLCFTGSIEQSEFLSNGFSIHSKVSKKRREDLIEKFNNGDIRQLFATGMLKEGINLPSIEVGLIIQLDNVERFFVQTHGRTLRSMYPLQYVMYVGDTQDETYVQTAIEGFNKDYVKFININEV